MRRLIYDVHGLSALREFISVTLSDLLKCDNFLPCYS